MKKKELLIELQEFFEKEGRLPSNTKERKLYNRMWKSKDPEVRKFWKEHREKRDTRPLFPTLKDFLREEGRLPSPTKEGNLYHRMYQSKDPEVIKFLEEHGKEIKKMDTRPLLPILKDFLREEGRLPSWSKERKLYHRMYNSKDPEVIKFLEEHREKKTDLLLTLKDFFREEGRLPSTTKERKLYKRMYNSKDPEVRKFWKEHREKEIDTRPLFPLLQDFFREEGRLPSQTKEPNLYARMITSKDSKVLDFWKEHREKEIDTRPLLPILKDFFREKGRLPSTTKEKNLYHRMYQSKDPEVIEFWKEHRNMKDTRPLLPTLEDFFREKGRLPSPTKEGNLYKRMKDSKDPEVRKFWEEHGKEIKKMDTRPLLPILKDFFREEGRLPSWSKERNLYNRMRTSKDPEVMKFVNLVKLLKLT